MTKVLALIAVLAVPVVLHGRLIRAWSYNELRDGAELVVVATPVEVKETAERAPLPGIQTVDRDGKASDVMAIGLETTFEILTTLKGNGTLKSLVLHHYREVRREPSRGGPLLVSFDPKEKKRFLLFLKAEADGRYTAVSGQTDPAIAVKQLEAEIEIP